MKAEEIKQKVIHEIDTPGHPDYGKTVYTFSASALNEYLIEELTDFGVFQYCKLNPTGGIEANLIRVMVEKYLSK